MSKGKLIRINIFGLLWTTSIFMCAKGVIGPSICLLVGMPAGVMFMKETRV